MRDALEHVPFYREAYAAAGIPRDDLREPSTLALLPTISKADLQRRAPDLPHPGGPEADRVFVTTGGATGAPVGLWHDREREGWEEAFAWRHWPWHGVRFLDRAANCRGTRPSGGGTIGVEPRAGLVLFPDLARAVVIDGCSFSDGVAALAARRVARLVAGGACQLGPVVTRRAGRGRGLF